MTQVLVSTYKITDIAEGDALCDVRKSFINKKLTQKICERKFYKKKFASQVADVEERIVRKMVEKCTERI